MKTDVEEGKKTKDDNGKASLNRCVLRWGLWRAPEPGIRGREKVDEEKPFHHCSLWVQFVSAKQEVRREGEWVEYGEAGQEETGETGKARETDKEFTKKTKTLPTWRRYVMKKKGTQVKTFEYTWTDWERVGPERFVLEYQILKMGSIL